MKERNEMLRVTLTMEDETLFPAALAFYAQEAVREVRDKGLLSDGMNTAVGQISDGRGNYPCKYEVRVVGEDVCQHIVE